MTTEAIQQITKDKDMAALPGEDKAALPEKVI
jgi:hypothetical protein